MATKKKAAPKRVPHTVDAPPPPVVPHVAKSTAVVSWREQAKAAVVHRKAEQSKLSASGGAFISFKGGITTIGGVRQKNPTPVILLATSWQRAYYANAYSPDVAATPACFSFDKQRPHAESPVPQSDICGQCRFNEFGSADNGKGKACKEGMRIAIIPADSINSLDTLRSAEIVTGTVSYLNSQTLRNFEAAVYADDPSWFFATLIKNEPDNKSQYALSFEAELIDDKVSDEAMQILAVRGEEARTLLAQPYKALEEKTAPANPARRRKF